jgi:exonuclease VII large subunit
VHDQAGEIVRSVKQAIPQSRVSIKVSDGEFIARVSGGAEGERA